MGAVEGKMEGQPPRAREVRRRLAPKWSDRKMLR